MTSARRLFRCRRASSDSREETQSPLIFFADESPKSPRGSADSRLPYHGPMSVSPSFAPVPHLETERLRLRYWDPDDVHALRAAIEANREHLAPWLPWASVDLEPLDQHRERLAHWRGLCDGGIDYIWGVFDPSGKEIRGGCGLHPRCGEGGLEIGYWIDRNYTRQGLATELSSALIRVGFEVARAKRIEIHTDVEHPVSSRIPRALGFTEEGVLRERIYYPDGRRRDKRVFSLLESEYPESPAARIPVKVSDLMGKVRDL